METPSRLAAALLVSLITTFAAEASPAPGPSRASVEAEKNRKAGEAFLAKNQGEEGVITLPSGLQYKVLKTGDGRKPTLEDTVVVHYRGELLDGTEFGNSYRGGKPGTFPLRASIAGWREALQLMPAGSKWQLFVPSHLAYGERGGGKAIGPNETLVLEAELISVLERDARAGSATAAVTGIELSYKLDDRLTRSLFLGDRWVSPATYSAPPQGKTATVRASVRGVDATGKRVAIAPRWTAADPGMVQVTGSGGEASITVKRAGESKLEVAFRGVTKQLTVRASQKDGGLAVEISQ